MTYRSHALAHDRGQGSSLDVSHVDPTIVIGDGQQAAVIAPGDPPSISRVLGPGVEDAARLQLDDLDLARARRGIHGNSPAVGVEAECRRVKIERQSLRFPAFHQVPDDELLVGRLEDQPPAVGVEDQAVGSLAEYPLPTADVPDVGKLPILRQHVAGKQIPAVGVEMSQAH